MNPIIIVVENGNIIMTPDEFKKHMNDAYNAGYSGGMSIYTSTTATINANTELNKWWNEV